MDSLVMKNSHAVFYLNFYKYNVLELKFVRRYISFTAEKYMLWIPPPISSLGVSSNLLNFRTLSWMGEQHALKPKLF